MLLVLAALLAPASRASSVTMLEGAVGVNFGLTVSGPGDIDGDGYADVLVGASGASYAGVHGEVSVYRGGPDGVSAIPSQVLVDDPADPYDDDLGGVLAPAGDVNGDGYADVVAGTRLNDGNPDYYSRDITGQVNLYLGSAAGLSATPAQVILPPVADGGFGRGLFHADVNVDGYSDVLVYRYADTGPFPAHGFSSNAGELYLYTGSATGTLTLAWTMSVPLSPMLPRVASDVALGDVTGDGVPDLVLGWGEGAEQLEVYEGTLAGFAQVPVFAYGYGDLPSGFEMTGVVDVDGDGFADVQGMHWHSMGAAGEWRMYTLFGSPTGLLTDPARLVVSYDRVVTVDDMDGDGAHDTVVVDPRVDRLFVHAGDNGLLAPARRVVAGAGANAWPAAVEAGDVDGDGLADLVVPSQFDHALFVPGGGITLWVDPLVAGGRLTGLLDDGQPGDRVVLLASPGAAAKGSCRAALEGLCLELATPRLVGSAVADANGQVAFSKPIPAGAAPGSIWTFQAVTIRTPDWTEVEITPPVTLTVGP